MRNVLEEVRRIKSIKIVHVEAEKPLQAEVGPLPEELGLHPLLVSKLRERGINRLYRFQGDAIRSILAGNHTIIVSGTGTGKTEAFMLPILHKIIMRPSRSVKALIIYPTKALARDQLAKLEAFTSDVFGVSAQIYDGDTPDSCRKKIYAMPPQILISNPDMVHVALQEVPAFKRLISKIRYVVLDELHTYSGVFGTHVAFIMRRIKRIAEEKPVFIGVSATIGNPEEHGENIFGEKPMVISSSMNRRSPIIHVMVRPLGVSRITAAIQLVDLMTKLSLKTLVFADSHRIVELLSRIGRDKGINIPVHRAGLPPRYRRTVEESFRRGRILALAATPTLELGIDIGDLDVIILLGVPPTYSRYLQRTGRCGRRGDTGFVFMILGDDPISAYYERHPREYYSMRPDPVVINLENDIVVKIQLLAMARDRWLMEDEVEECFKDVYRRLISEGYLKIRGKFTIPTIRAVKLLRSRRNLRGTGPTIKIVDERGRFVGTREMPMAMRELYPGAIYYVAGKPYESVRLELDAKRAIVRSLPYFPPYYTIALHTGNLVESEEVESRIVDGVYLRLSNIVVEEQVYAFLVKDAMNNITISEEPLDNILTYSYRTQAVVAEYPAPPHYDFNDRIEGFHALEHALIASAQTIAGGSPSDLGGLSYPSGHIVIYDSVPGGSGLSKLIFRNMNAVHKRAMRILSECNCADGCPKCVFSPYCGNNNRMLSRLKALKILNTILEYKHVREPTKPEGEPIA